MPGQILIANFIHINKGVTKVLSQKTIASLV